MLFSSGKTTKDPNCSDESVRSGLAHENSTVREKAIKCLYANCLPHVKNMVIHNSGTETDAEDLFQDALCILLYNIDILKKEVTGSPQAYLKSIARKKWLNTLRARRVHEGGQVEFKDEGLLDDPAGMEALLDRERLFDAQEACMAQMTPKCRSILDGIYFESRQRMDNLAESQDLANAHTARQTKYRCLLKLKDCIAKRLQV